MRFIFTLLLCLWFGPASAQWSEGRGWLTGAGGLPLAKSGACTNNITVDGSGVSSAGGSTTSTVTITTTQTNDLILLAVQANASNPTTIADGAGLTWTQLGTVIGTMQVYSAFSTGVLTSDVITITYAALPGFDSIVAWGLHGTVTSSFFDPNGALPGTTTTSTPLTLTTSNACDFLFAAYSDNSGSVTAGAGFTLISGSGGNFMGVEYKIVTATQSALSMTVSGGTSIKNGIGDAVKSN